MRQDDCELLFTEMDALWSHEFEELMNFCLGESLSDRAEINFEVFSADETIFVLIQKLK